jgi:hypothetical protein
MNAAIDRRLSNDKKADLRAAPVPKGMLYFSAIPGVLTGIMATLEA